MNVADVQSTMKGFGHSAIESAGQAAQWMKRSVTVLGQHAYDLLTKISSIASEAFSLASNFVKNSFYTTKNWTIRNFYFIRDYVSTHPREMKAAGIGAAAALVAIAIGYALCCRNTESTA